VESESGAVEISSLDLEQLMARYQNGDSVAAERLIGQLAGRLYSFFAAQSGSRAEAGDMTQEAWLRIHRVRHTYRPGEPVLPWIYAIARRVRIDNYRKRRRIQSREIATDVLPAAPAPARESGDEPSFADLVAPLPVSQREALTLLKVNGLSIEEVARATASTPGAVKQRIHRAYERLRCLLQRQTPAAEPGGGQ
jgi:RNA polymerase sigma-70 factor (ECF subfamily)